MDSNPYETPKSEVEPQRTETSDDQYRKSLVPLWIKIFGWLFIFLGVTAPLGYAYTLLSQSDGEFGLLGLEATGSTLSFTALFLMLVFVSFGVSAYGLLFGKMWGVKACLVSGYIGVGIAIYSMGMGLMNNGVEVRLELLIQIPYLIKLHKLKALWDQ